MVIALGLGALCIVAALGLAMLSLMQPREAQTNRRAMAIVALAFCVLGVITGVASGFGAMVAGR